MGFYDNGGMVGKVPDYTNNDYKSETSTTRNIVYVGGTSGLITPSATAETTVSLLSLAGGADIRPLANDVVILSYSFGSYTRFLPATWGSTATAVEDSICSAILSLNPANTTQVIEFHGVVTANITPSTATTTLVNLPANTSANDVVVIAYGIGSTVSRTAQFNLAAQGYTNAAILTVSDTYDGNLGVFYKVMGSTPNTNVTIPATGATQDNGIVAISVFRYVNNLDPLGNTSVTTDITASTRRPTWGVHTPQTPDVMMVLCAAAAHGGGTAELGFTSTNPLQGFVTSTSNGVNDVTIGMGHILMNTNTFIQYNTGVQNTTTISTYTNIARQYAIGTGGAQAYVTGHSVQYKIMGNTPDTSVTLPASGVSVFAGTYAIQVWRYVDNDNVLDVSPNSFTQGTYGGNTTYFSLIGSEYPNTQPITPQTPNSVIVVVGATATAAGAVYNNPGSISNFLAADNPDTVDSQHGMFSYNWVSGQYNPPNFISSSTESTTASSSSVTLALRPALRNIRNYSSNKKNNSGMWNNNARFLARKNNSSSYASIVDKTGVVSSDYTGANNVLSLTLPKNIKNNDLILFFAGADAATTTAQFNNTTYKPSGFNLIKYAGDYLAALTRGGAHVAAFYKIADGTEGGTSVTLSAQTSINTSLTASAFVLRDTNIINPIGNIGSNNSSTGLVTLNIPGVTSSGNNSIVFLVATSDSSGDLGASLTNYSNNSIDWNLNENTLVGGIGSDGATGPGNLIIGWKYLTSVGDSSETCTTYLYATANNLEGFQFEIKSNN